MIGTPLPTLFAAATLWLSLPQASNGSQREAPKADSSQSATSYLREMRYLDADGDKRISAQELARGQQTASLMLMLSWDESDRDGDGVISLAEFQSAAEEAMQTLLDLDSESDQQAEDALARAIGLDVLLDRLASNDRYADEIAALREAIEELEDDEAVITYLIKYATHFPRLSPVIKAWLRHYPVRPGLRRLAKPGPPRAYRPPGKAKLAPPPKPGPKGGKPHPRKPPKPGRKPPPPRRP